MLRLFLLSLLGWINLCLTVPALAQGGNESALPTDNSSPLARQGGGFVSLTVGGYIYGGAAYTGPTLLFEANPKVGFFVGRRGFARRVAVGGELFQMNYSMNRYNSKVGGFVRWYPLLTRRLGLFAETGVAYRTYVISRSDYDPASGYYSVLSVVKQSASLKGILGGVYWVGKARRWGIEGIAEINESFRPTELDPSHRYGSVRTGVHYVW